MNGEEGTNAYGDELDDDILNGDEAGGEAEGEGEVEGAAAAEEGAGEGAEAAGGAEGAAAAADEPAPKEPMIPKSRFDAGLRAARQRADDLQAELDRRTQANTNGQQDADDQKALQTLQDEYEDALLDGRKSEAATKRAEIQRLTTAITDRRINAAAQNASRSAVESMNFNALVDQLEREFPVLDDASESYDQDVENELAMMADAFIRQGETKTEALRRAAGYVLGFGRGAPAAEPAKAAPAKADEVRAARSAEGRKRAAQATKEAPASLAKVGLGSDRAGNKEGDVDVGRLTMEEFDKMTEEQKAALRGDVIS